MTWGAVLWASACGAPHGSGPTHRSEGRPTPPSATAVAVMAPSAIPRANANGWLRPKSPEPASDLARKWLDVTDEDPRVTAIRTGVPLDDGDALAATHGLIARVHLATGEIVGLGTVPTEPRFNSDCRGTHTKSAVWVACNGAGEFIDFGHGERHRAVALFQVDIEQRNPRPLPPVFQHAPAPDLPVVFSESGGVLFNFACENAGDNDNSSCARQPDGTWRSIRTVSEIRELVALADGRVASIRQESGGWFLRVFDQEGHSRDTAMSRYPEPVSELADVYPFDGDEGADGIVRFVLRANHVEEDRGVWVGRISVAGDDATLTRIEGAATADLNGRFGLAFGREVPLVTVDHGATWSALPALPPYIEGLSSSRRATREVRAISAVGVETNDLFRLGW